MRPLLPVLITALISLGTLGAEPEFKPRHIVQPFKAIVNAPHIKASKINSVRKLVEDDELVLGITIGKASRAYPVNMLTNPTREIINDKLGGKHIATTW